MSRQFYNSPYLFYHDIRPIEKKRNQRDCYDIIKTGVKEAIRKILPVQHILDKYLGDNIKFGNDEIDKPISAIESENLKQLISQDLNNGNSNYESNITKSTENNNFIPLKLVEKMTEINTVKKILPKEDSSDDETINLLSEIKKNIININSERPVLNQGMMGGENELVESDNINSDNIASVPITNYYSENKNQINEELVRHENQQRLRDSDRNNRSERVDQRLRESDRNNRSERSDQRLRDSDRNNRSERSDQRLKDSDKQISERAKDSVRNEDKDIKKKHIDSESSAMYIGNDDDYEDVFSNINDTYLSENNKKKTLDNKVINKKMKDAYFSRFNAL